MMQFVFKTCSFAVVSSQACWVKCYTHDNLRCFFKDFSLAGVGDDFRFHLVFVACLVKVPCTGSWLHHTMVVSRLVVVRDASTSCPSITGSRWCLHGGFRSRVS